MQTNTILSIFFVAFILDIIRSINSSEQSNYKPNNSKYDQFKKKNEKTFQNEKINNPSMKMKDESGEDIKISYDNVRNQKKNNLIYLTIQFCQS